MAFPVVFLWFVLAILIFRHHLRKNSKAQDEVTRAFWKKEESSLIVRKKSLDPEDYIHPSLTVDDFKGEDYYQGIGNVQLYRHETYLLDLLPLDMVNFSHMTNTDLRINFGTAMLTVIEKNENNYTAYINTLFKLAKGVFESGDLDYACQLLEEGIKVGTDNRQHILLLAELYLKQNRREAFDNLYQLAEQNESLTKKALLESLNEMIQ